MQVVFETHDSERIIIFNCYRIFQKSNVSYRSDLNVSGS